MTVLMHLSDMHFGAHDPLACAAVQRLAQRLGVAMVVVSGDLTQRATAEQFEQAARFVQGVHARSSLVLERLRLAALAGQLDEAALRSVQSPIPGAAQ